MGEIYSGNGWLIRVQGNEHPPVHIHVLHPNGKALITLDGDVKNSGVPAKVIAHALRGNSPACRQAGAVRAAAYLSTRRVVTAFPRSAWG